MPVAILRLPVPSSDAVTRIEVSPVDRSTLAVRMGHVANRHESVCRRPRSSRLRVLPVRARQNRKVV